MIPARTTPFPGALVALVLAIVCPMQADAASDFRVRIVQSTAEGTPIEEIAADLSGQFGVYARPTVPPALRASIAREHFAGAAWRGNGVPEALAELTRWVRISIPDENAGPTWAALAADWRIDRVEEVAVAEVCGVVPDDPLLRNQQGWLEQTGLEAAWAAASSDVATRVRVAVIDGGTDWNHPDLLANVAVNELEIADDGIDQDGNGFVDDVRGWNFPRDDADPSPLAGQPSNARHGTHVAGIIGGVLGNGIGIAGAGANPELILVNAAHPTTDGGIGYGYEGILYAISRGADIINCSWRTVRVIGGEMSDAAYSEFEALVLRLARESGALVVAAVGNEAADDLWTTPAGYDDVFSVTATAMSGGEVELWPLSNVAPWIDVAAPGVGVASTFPEGQTSALPGAYGLLSGTSMAAAVASGVAALAKREHPEWSESQLRTRLRWTASAASLPGDLRVVRADVALTSEDRPDVDITLRGLVDSGGDGLAEGGETIDLVYDIGAAFERQQVFVETWTDDPWIVPLISRMGLPSVPAGGSVEVLRGLKYWVDPATPLGHVARVQLRAVVGPWSGPVESGVVLLRPLSGSLSSESLEVTASANGVLGQPTPFVSVIEPEPALTRPSDVVGFLRRAALLVGNSPEAVSDALLPRAPGIRFKDFVPHPPTEGLRREVTGDGTPELRLSYADLGSPNSLGLRVEQRVRSYPAASVDAFVLLDYEIGAFDDTVADLRWGLALDWSVPAADGLAGRGRLDESYVVTEGFRGMRVQAPASAAPASGVAGLLVLGEATGLGFSGLAQWTLDGEPGWNIPEDARATVSDAVLWSRMAPGVDDATLGVEGDRIAIVSGSLGTIESGSSRSFSIALAIATDPASLHRTLEKARVTWEASEIGLTPETLGSGILWFSNNPFRADTELSYALTQPGRARVDVYDFRGRRVRTLLDEARGAGVHRVSWDGRDLRGRAVASGIYLVQLQTPAGTSTQRVTRVR